MKLRISAILAALAVASAPGAALADIAPDPPSAEVAALVPAVRAAGIDCDRARDSWETEGEAADRLRSQGWSVITLDCQNSRRAMVATKPRRWPWEAETPPQITRLPDRPPRPRRW